MCAKLQSLYGSFVKRASFILFLFASISLVANSVSANMVLTPLKLEMGRNASVTTVSVTNNNEFGGEVLYQATALLWSGHYDEKFATKKQKRIVVSPAIFRLAPGQTRVLRVHAVDKRALLVPSSYRVVVSSMPPVKSRESLLALRKNISLPLLVEGGFPIR